jgi:hypothetical protein
MAKEVVVTAEQVKKRRKANKILAIVLLVLLILLLIFYFIMNIIYNEGSFTISMDKYTYLNSDLVMFESMNDRSSVIKLSASKLEFMDNISIKWLPSKEELTNYEGSHNGENYIAYSFYLQNRGDSNINYWYKVIMDDVIKEADNAVRVMIIVNDQETVYAKRSPITGEAEPETTMFREDSDGTVILEQRAGMVSDQIDKITIVIWLEGDDPECVNAILGGEMKMHMEITEEHTEEESL